ncbi:MAG TPA: GNAT family N-acetyltransferase [Mycobacterium sp.]|jgi:ribosomal protein S18 acetylase RimI-like enzyme|nr:GNAT family N-acetyltransferase [Mycobacterium sp.]
MIIRGLTRSDVGDLAGLFGRLSDRDITVIRENVHDLERTERLADAADLRWVAVADAGRVVGYAAVNRLPGWSDHVGELRLVVEPSLRGSGIGRKLSQQALRGAFSIGIRKVVIELATNEDAVLEMFSRLGFTGEALLRNHIRDREGGLRDLVILAHDADESWETLRAIGVTEALDEA